MIAHPDMDIHRSWLPNVALRNWTNVALGPETRDSHDLRFALARIVPANLTFFPKVNFWAR